METIAVYRETVIKTYGFTRRAGLWLMSFEWTVPDGGPAASRNDGPVSKVFKQVRARCREILMVAADSREEDVLRMRLLIEPVRVHDDKTVAGNPADTEALCDGVHLQGPVDAVFFQGPHFGDRYGIASAALGVLEAAQVPVLLMNCGGSYVCIVVEHGRADNACRALTEAFAAPAGQGGAPA